VERTHYYVLLTLIEVAPETESGDAWDMGGGAPDIVYEIRWQGQRVFRSSKKSDTLVAKWSNTSIGVSDVVDGVSIDSSIKAARITVRRGEDLEFIVYDNDIASPDEIGRWTIASTDLRQGDQTWRDPGGRVVSATCRVLPMDDLKFEELTK